MFTRVLAIPRAPRNGPRPRRRRALRTALIAVLLTAAAVGLGFASRAAARARKQEADETYPICPEPRVAVQFIDGPVFYRTASGKIEIVALKNCMRFGIYLPGVPDPNERPENPTRCKCLTFFPEGISNNTCVKIDGEEYLLGSTSKGEWRVQSKPLGKTRDGRVRSGRKAVFFFKDEKIQVTQIVEVIPSDEPSEVTDKKGKRQMMRLLDTVLVRYEIENQDSRPHTVGIRFLLDTYIGSNDGVPFTIPGQTSLVDTKMDFDPSNPNNKQRARDPNNPTRPAPIPDYIQALEKADLANPGTIARISLQVGHGLEAPTRVTLGAWPHGVLRFKDARARQHMTLWKVPFLSMQEPELVEAGGKDSAVVMYWNEKVLAPEGKRQVGFAYGLGDVAASGKLALTVSKSIVVGQEFTVTALVRTPTANERLTLRLPAGLKLVKGKTEQQVPPLPKDSDTKLSPVTWTVEATRSGTFRLKVESRKGAVQQLVRIKAN